jgi:hypothetical protein
LRLRRARDRHLAGVPQAARDDPAGRPLDEVGVIRDELDKRIEAFLAKLVPPDDSAAER